MTMQNYFQNHIGSYVLDDLPGNYGIVESYSMLVSSKENYCELSIIQMCTSDEMQMKNTRQIVMVTNKLPQFNEKVIQRLE